MKIIQKTTKTSMAMPATRHSLRTIPIPSLGVEKLLWQRAASPPPTTPFRRDRIRVYSQAQREDPRNIAILVE